MAEESEIRKFYHGQNIFITGATGFVGHVLLEKLLRSTELTTIYVLMREKKGKTIQKRLDNLFDCVLFDKLRNERPDFQKQVVPLAGDCSLKGLGLSREDRQKLVSEVNIVFHGAATVRFDENLKVAYTINVNGTIDILELCKEMKNLKSVVYISTAYSNCYMNTIEEKFYDFPVSFADFKKKIESVTKEEADKITPNLITGWPNTYSFTKALSEFLIRETASDLPIGVYRPSIIISTYKEPIEGWTNNFYGPTGAIVASAVGLVHVHPADADLVCDLVPVDTCVAGLVAAAWDIGQRNASEIPIYNYVSTVENSLTWNDYYTLNLIHGIKYPPTKSAYILISYYIPMGPKYYFWRTIFHNIPAILMDTVCFLTGRKGRQRSLINKIHKFSDAVSFFSNREWTFKNDNVRALWDKMNTTDKKLFPLSMQTVSWTMYYRNYFKWLRVYLLKDPLDTVDKARVRYAYMTVAHNCLKFLGIFIVVTLIWVVILKVFGL